MPLRQNDSQLNFSNVSVSFSHKLGHFSFSEKGVSDEENIDLFFLRFIINMVPTQIAFEQKLSQHDALSNTGSSYRGWSSPNCYSPTIKEEMVTQNSPRVVVHPQFGVRPAF